MDKSKAKMIFQIIALVAVVVTLFIMLFIPYHGNKIVKETVIEPRGDATAIEAILRANDDLTDYHQPDESTFFTHTTSGMGTSEMLISLAIMVTVLASAVVLILGIVKKKNGFHYFFFLPIVATVLWFIIYNGVGYNIWSIERDNYLSGYGYYTSRITTVESHWMHFEVILALLIIASLAFTVVGIMSIAEEKKKKEATNLQNLGRVISKSVATPKTPTSSVSAADELQKYKKLLDAGAITQEEYDAKKQQLLGL